ncbi:hypothetical protein FLLO111716_13685 [Flavobacterium longum]|uniref:hypothetical protein n=1 Tax=Flavobacterium longum TaxID=1299340 RepID=UPI0039EAC652
MDLQLLKGQFSATDAIDLLTQVVQVKIQFHERKIERTHNEEDIKMRETRIKELQDGLHAAKTALRNQQSCALESTISIH